MHGVLHHSQGGGKTYLLTEGIDAVIGVCLNIWFYTRYGLAGIDSHR